MTLLLISLIVLIFLGFIALFCFLNKRFKDFERGKIEKDTQGILMLQGQLGEIRENIQAQIEKLGKLDQTNQQVANFASQLQSLQDILKSPKQRGVLGEIILETVLKNVLPPNAYQMQYSLGDDEETGKNLIVDAVIFVKDKVVPIDAKFSLENYSRLINEHDAEKKKQLEKLFRQDLKNRIDETSKYIKPRKKTLDFAFMFIPSEAIYYDLLINQVGAVKEATSDLVEYAFKEKRVIIVSPTNFWAYLQTVLLGLRYLQIEESTKEIQKNVEELGKRMLRYNGFLNELGQRLGRTVDTYNEAHKEFKKIDKNILRITEEKRNEIEPLSLEKPKYD